MFCLLASERVPLRSNTIENGDVCLLIYMCGPTYVILYFDPRIIVFGLQSTPSHTSTKLNLSV